MDVRHRYVWAAVLTLSLSLSGGCAARTTGVIERDASTALAIVADAEQTLDSFLAGKSGDVLKRLLRRAKGMMIISSAGEFGFLLTIGGGNGVLLANVGNGWTGPVFMTRGGVGWGYQAGFYGQSGVILFMDEEDVRYVLETGLVFKGQSRLVFFNANCEFGVPSEFYEAGDVYVVRNRTGLFAGVAFDTGGFVNRPALNEALSGVVGGDPVTVLYGAGARPEAAGGLRERIGCAALAGALIKEKDGIEIPSH